MMHGKIAKKHAKIQSKNGGNKQTEIQTYPGSYDDDYIYLIKNRNGDQKYARIIEPKLLDNLDPSIPKSFDSYKYYVHYIGQGRRHDEYVDVTRMKKTEFTLEMWKRDKPDALKDLHESSEEEGLDEANRKAHEDATKIKTVIEINIGRFVLETWYFSPFPEGYHNGARLYFCEYCLNFYNNVSELQRHLLRCDLLCPPGNQIYEDKERKFVMFEVDGTKNWKYCENLSYLAKLFLDHKLVLYSTDPFLFYVLCEKDEYGFHIVGYFSKNKDFQDPLNLSCILVLPCYGRKGYGKFLIEFSYELSVIEGKTGTPERPLSDLGRVTYLAYWTQRLIDYFRSLSQEELAVITIKQISDSTRIKEGDIIMALEEVKMIKKVGSNTYLCLDETIMQPIYKKYGRPSIKINRDNLHWIPYKQKYDENIYTS